MYLMIEFPHFHLNFVEYRVVYYQRVRVLTCGTVICEGNYVCASFSN